MTGAGVMGKPCRISHILELAIPSNHGIKGIHISNELAASAAAVALTKRTRYAYISSVPLTP